MPERGLGVDFDMHLCLAARARPDDRGRGRDVATGDAVSDDQWRLRGACRKDCTTADGDQRRGSNGNEKTGADEHISSVLGSIIYRDDVVESSLLPAVVERRNHSRLTGASPRRAWRSFE